MFIACIVFAVCVLFTACDIQKTAHSNLPIQQWAMENDGSFNIKTSSIGTWDTDAFHCTKNVDIDWTDKFEGKAPKRPCTVAVIDGGFDTAHVVFENANIIDAKIMSADRNNVHGTAVLSVLCGRSELMNSPLSGTDVCLLPIPAIGERGETQFASIVSAIRYAESEGAAICNLSIECYTDSEGLRAAVRDSKMLFCVSAGNDGLNIDDDVQVYPACYSYENLIVVGDIRCDGKLSKQSNYGGSLWMFWHPGRM
jgi:hypothetical protein